MIRIIPEQRRNLDQAARQDEPMQRPLSRRDRQARLANIVRNRQKWIEDHYPQDDDCIDILIVVDDPPIANPLTSAER